MEAQTTEIVVLNKEQYKKLEQQLPAPTPSGSTTEVQAGFLLGIQHVLKQLREGWVVK